MELGEAPALLVGHEQVHRPECGQEAGLDRLAQLLEASPSRPSLDGARVAECELAPALVVQQVDLVQREQPRPLRDADFGKHVVHRGQHLRELAFRHGGVGHVHDQIRPHRLLGVAENASTSWCGSLRMKPTVSVRR